MEKVSRILSRLMLALFALLLAAALFLGTVANYQHKSYLAALAAALVLTLLLWLADRRKLLLPRLERIGAGRLALLLAALSLMLNLLWACTHPLQPGGDYATFWGAACALAKGEALPNPSYVSLFPHIMGYAGFLSLFLRLLGCRLAVAVGLNIALSLLSGLLIFSLCLRWRGLRAAFFGGLLWALCPSGILFNTMVLSEPLYTCLLLAFLRLASGFDRRTREGRPPRLWLWILGGALAGLLLWGVNIARPIAAVLLIALAIWILLLRGKDLKDRRSWLCWGLFFALLLAVCLPLGKLWNGYLTRRIGEEPPPLPGYNIYVGFNPETGGSYSEEDMALLLEYRARTGSAVRAQECMLQEARERIGSDELSFPRLFAQKLKTFLGHDEAGAYYTQEQLPELRFSLWSLLSNVFYYAAALLALLAVWRLLLRREHSLLLLVPLYFIGLTLAQMLVEVAARYHYSLIPMLIILAGCFFGKKEEKA